MKLSSEVIVRQSNFNFKELKPILEQVSTFFENEDYIRIIEIVKNNKKIRDSILVSSPDFLKTCFNFEKLSDKKKRNVCLTFYKYLNRMLYRATPFGIFSSVGKAITKNTDTETNFLISNFETKQHLNFSLEIQEYFYDKLVTNIAFVNQSSILCKANTSIKETTNYIDYFLPNISLDEREGNKILFQKNRVLEFIYEKSLEGVYSISKLISLTKEKFSNDFSNEIIESLILELLKIRFILLDVYPFVLSEESLNVLRSDSKLPIIDEIEAVINIGKEFNESGNIDLLKKISFHLEDANRLNKYNITQEIANEIEFFLSNTDKKQIQHLAQFVLSNFNKSLSDSRHKVNIYKEKFSERYGHYRAVSLIEVFDEISGLGSPFTEELIIDKLKYDEIKWKNELKLEYSKNQNEFFDLSIFYEHQRNMGELGFDLNFNIYDIDGKVNLTLGRSAYSRSPRSYHGRFGFLNLDENDNYTHGLIYYPKNTKIKNLGVALENQYQSNLVINGIKKSSEDLTLSEIYLKLTKDNEFILQDVHGRVLNIDIRSMINLDLTNDYIKFIGLLSSKTDKIGSLLGILESLNEFHQKRIVFEDIVLVPEKWNLTKDMLLSYDIEGVINLFNSYCIPKKVKLMIEDQVLVLDITKKIDVELFIDILKKEGKIEVYECYGECYTYTNLESLATELTFTFYNRRVSSHQIQPVIEVKDRLQIMENNYGWFYVKLYTYKNLQDQLLIYLNRYFKDITMSWFYLRYSDDRPHIRFRIYIDSESKYNLYDIFHLVTSLLSNGVIDDYSICPYEREYERYGIKNYPLVEKIFEFDSKLCLDLLEKRKVLSDLKFKWLIVYSSIEIFQQLLKQVNNYEFLFYKKGELEDKNILKSIIRLSDSKNLNLIKSNINFKKLVEFIGLLHLENVEQLLDSLLHMHFNRLFGDLEVESKYRNYILGVLNFEIKRK